MKVDNRNPLGQRLEKGVQIYNHTCTGWKKLFVWLNKNTANLPTKQATITFAYSVCQSLGSILRTPKLHFMIELEQNSHWPIKKWQDVHRRDWKTYARQNQGARSTHPTRPYWDLRRFRACPLHRTQATLERSKVYWSWPLLLHAQSQRGNSYKTSP